MTNIFISYRRADSQGYVGRLHDYLLKYFAEEQIFLDVSSLKGGEEFKARIERIIPTCRALLAIIGPRWLDMRGEGGRRRLDNPEDFVRLEIASALQHRLQIIPVLVAGAQMPPGDTLPAPLKALTKLNALELSQTRFAFDVERLVKDLGGSFGDIPISLGSTYRSLIRTRVLNPQEVLEVRVDRKLVGQIQGPRVRLVPAQPKEPAWNPVRVRIEEELHTLQVIAKSDSFNPGRKSNALSFKLKGGQKLAFIVDRENTLLGQAKLNLKADKPIYEE
jgi:hypothetical protein